MDLKIGGFGAHVGRFVLSIAPSATTVSLGVTRRGRNDAKLKGSDVALGTTIPGLASFWPRGGKLDLMNASSVSAFNGSQKPLEGQYRPYIARCCCTTVDVSSPMLPLATIRPVSKIANFWVMARTKSKFCSTRRTVQLRSVGMRLMIGAISSTTDGCNPSVGSSMSSSLGS